MTETVPEMVGTLGRLPDGKINAPQRYVDYADQLVVRTRFGTSQRWVKQGWNPGRRGTAPYLLGAHYCRDEDDDREPMNPELDVDEVELYYVDENDRERYEVRD